jgi:hypothetical protein
LVTVGITIHGEDTIFAALFVIGGILTAIVIYMAGKMGQQT